MIMIILTVIPVDISVAFLKMEVKECWKRFCHLFW